VAVGATYKGYRYPIEVIGHAVWLYHRFALSLRDVEELLLARGVVVTRETIRSRCAKFGCGYANQLRRRRPRPGDKWHLDEVFVKINGTTHYLWRARSTSWCNHAVMRWRPSGFSESAHGLGVRAAGDCHRQTGQLSGRSQRGFAVGDPSPLQVPQQPGRELPPADQDPGTDDETLRLKQHFVPRRRLMSAPQWRTQMTNRFAVWDDITAAVAV
jgi:putative transposase